MQRTKILIVFCFAWSLAAQTNTVLPLGVYLTAPPTLSNGNYQNIQLDSAGRLIVNCGTGCSSTGGTAAQDEATFTQGTTNYTPIGGTYNTSITNLTAGQGGAVQLTNDRMMYVNVGKFGGTAVVTGTGASGSGIPRVTVANDSNILATQSGNWTSRIVGNAGGVLDAAQNAAAPANVLQIAGVFNTTPGAITAGNVSAPSLDNKGAFIIDPIANGCGATRYESVAAFLPSTSTQITATQTCVSKIIFSNSDSVTHYIYAQDQGTGCNSAACQWLNGTPIAAFSPFTWDAGGSKFPGGLKLNADVANKVIYNIVGNQ